MSSFVKFTMSLF